jgi:GPH family glycoside/pentoside/hexuronide:cation symporter
LIQLQEFPTLAEGSRFFAIAFACLVVPLAALPFFLNREPLYPSVARRGKEPFRDSILQALANHPFRRIAFARAAYSFTYNLVAIFGLYLNYYAVFRGNIRSAAIMQGWNGTIFQVSGIVSLLVLRRLALLHGKKEAALAAIAAFGAGCVMKLFVYIPGHPWLQTIVYVANGVSAAGMTAPVDAMLADVADFDEMTSGRRREGMYASVLAWFDRTGNAAGTLLSGFLLVWLGFDAARGGDQPEETLRWMRIGYFAVPALGACATFWLLRKYPLDEKACRQMRAELLARREASA